MSREEESCVLNIAIIGQSKSLFLQSIDAAEKGNDELAQQYFYQAKELMKQINFVKYNQEIEDFPTQVLYLHMQNHMTSAEIIEILASKLIKLYEMRKG